jgi:hypothetical protein
LSPFFTQGSDSTPLLDAYALPHVAELKRSSAPDSIFTEGNSESVREQAKRTKIGTCLRITCLKQSIRQSIMRSNARAFVQARFTFSIQPATSSASFRSTTRIESCDVVIV